MGAPPLNAADLKGLRRWVVVAGVWAVAATTIALIALLDTSGSQAERRADAAADRSAKAERALARRLDAVETRLDGLPQSDDLSKLEERLARAERSASEAAESSRSAAQKVDDLESRVKRLSQNPGSGGGAGDEQRP